jgi:Tfp pilus assembly PilM family ATPase
MFSLPHPWAQQLANDLVECRLSGEALDALPLALARAVAMAPGAAAETTAAIDWGCQRATFCVVHRGVAAFVRCLRDAGFAQVSSAVCSALSVSADEAQNLLVDHGLLLPGQGNAGQLAPVIEEVTAGPRAAFVEEVQRTLVYLRQQRRALVPSRVLLFGAGAVVRNMAEYLSRKLEVPVSVWSLAGDVAPPQRERTIPAALLGPAIALSSLAWVRT